VESIDRTHTSYEVRIGNSHGFGDPIHISPKNFSVIRTRGRTTGNDNDLLVHWNREIALGKEDRKPKKP
jgi:hypothetical protein